jgi:hypothetical protein
VNSLIHAALPPGPTQGISITTTWPVSVVTRQALAVIRPASVKGWPVPAFIFPADWRPASDHSEPPASPASSIDDRAPPPPPASSLGNKTAAIALEARLRSAGIAVR